MPGHCFLARPTHNQQFCGVSPREPILSSSIYNSVEDLLATSVEGKGVSYPSANNMQKHHIVISIFPEFLLRQPWRW